MQTPNDSTALGVTRDWLRRRVDKGEQCPCCKQLAKVYKRSIYASMAVALIEFYRATAPCTDFAHVSQCKAFEIRTAVSGDFAKLAHWGLIQERPKTAGQGHKRTSGFWRVTQDGIKFINNKITIPKWIKIYDGRRIGFDDSVMVSIRDCLGEKFNYERLMGM